MKLEQIEISEYRSDNVLSEYQNIRQIGIQGKPGLQFKLNEGGIINLNKTGIFELNSDFIFLYSLTFKNNIEDEQWSTVIVDIVYEDKKEENE